MLFNDAHGQLYFFTGILCTVNNKEMIDKFIHVCGSKKHDDSDKIIGGATKTLINIHQAQLFYKVVQIGPGLMSPDLHTNSPVHI